MKGHGVVFHGFDKWDTKAFDRKNVKRFGDRVSVTL